MKLTINRKDSEIVKSRLQYLYTHYDKNSVDVILNKVLNGDYKRKHWVTHLEIHLINLCNTYAKQFKKGETNVGDFQTNGEGNVRDKKRGKKQYKHTAGL